MNTIAFFKKNYILLLILGVAAFLRIYGISDFPTPGNQDELNNFYDAYSISETGTDRFGREYPILLRGFGNEGFPTALYSWLATAPIALFGNTIAAGRSIAVLLGIFSILLIYLFTKNAFGKSAALFAAGIASISPIHILYSRIGIESSILPAFFIILILYVWQLAGQKRYSYQSIILLGLCIGFSTNAYTASRISALLFAFVCSLEILFLKSEKRTHTSSKTLLVFVIATGMGASAQLIAFINEPIHFMGRGNGVLIPFYPIDIFLKEFIHNIAANLEPSFLFLDFRMPNNLSIDRFLPVMVIPYLLFPVYLIHTLIYKNNRGIQLVVLSIIITCIPASISNPNPHSLRASGLVVLIPICVGLSLNYLYTLDTYFKTTAILISGKVAALLILMIGFVNFYQHSKEYIQSEGLQSDYNSGLMYRTAVQLNRYKDNYDKIAVERFGNQSYIHVLFACNIHPNEFRAMNKINYTGASFDFLTRMGNYYFIDPIAVINKREQMYRTKDIRYLLIGTQKLVPDTNIIDQLIHYGDTVYFQEYLSYKSHR